MIAIAIVIAIAITIAIATAIANENKILSQETAPLEVLRGTVKVDTVMLQIAVWRLTAI